MLLKWPLQTDTVSSEAISNVSSCFKRNNLQGRRARLQTVNCFVKAWNTRRSENVATLCLRFTEHQMTAFTVLHEHAAQGDNQFHAVCNKTQKKGHSFFLLFSLSLFLCVLVASSSVQSLFYTLTHDWIVLPAEFNLHRCTVFSGL